MLAAEQPGRTGTDAGMCSGCIPSTTAVPAADGEPRLVAAETCQQRTNTQRADKAQHVSYNEKTKPANKMFIDFI